MTQLSALTTIPARPLNKSLPHATSDHHQVSTTPSARALWLYIHLPQLPLEVLTRGVVPQQPYVLINDTDERPQVVLSNRHAASLGIHSGMPLAAAHALAELKVLKRRPQTEQRALERLALWAMQITPQVCVAAPDGLLLEIRGSLRLFGGLDNLLNRVRQGFRRLGYRADYAVAPTPLAAGLLARTTPRQVVRDIHEMQTLVSALPVSALSLESKAEQAIKSLGVKTIGDCRRLPRDGLSRRFSKNLLDVLDRLYGQQPDPRRAFPVPKSFDHELELPWEVDNAQALIQAGERLLDELCGYLKACSASARSLRWRLISRDNELEYFDLRLSRPARDSERMMTLLRETLMRRKISVPLRGIGLNVTDISVQTTVTSDDLFDKKAQENSEAYAAFTERLRARCGPHALRRLGLSSSHQPEKAWHWQQAVDVLETRPSGLASASGRRKQRPLWLLKQAVKLGVNENRPVLDGPLSLRPDRERIISGWWGGEEVARDYFIASTEEGGRLWIYKDLAGEREWYLHGVFE